MKFEMIDNKAVWELKKFMEESGVTATALALKIGITPPRICEILSGKRRITISTDLRLCKFFKLNHGHFYRAQMEYEFKKTAEDMKEILAKIKPNIV